MTTPTIDARSDVSCYVKIGGYTFYLEVSPSTENKPSVSYWHKSMPLDAYTNMIEEEREVIRNEFAT